jgi:hypothetical protein
MSRKIPKVKKEKQKERDRKQRQWEQEDKTIKDLRRKAPYIKMIVRGRGCVLPFYDYLDSYSDEFQRIDAAARAEHPSLIGVHEVDEHTFAESEKNWLKLGYGNLQQVFFDMDRELSEYGKGSPNANLCGSMSAFLDSDQNVRSVILIRQTVKGTLQHRELKYALKLASLLHEVGHVHDLEQGLNFDVPAKRFRVIEAEVFAHLFALEQMAKRNLRQSFNMLIDGLRDAIPKGGYGSEVAKKVLDQLPEYQLIDWQSVFSQPPTPDEVKKLGPKGIEAIKN